MLLLKNQHQTPLLPYFENSPSVSPQILPQLKATKIPQEVWLRKINTITQMFRKSARSLKFNFINYKHFIYKLSLFPFPFWRSNQYIDKCLLSNDIMDYHVVAQGKTTIPGVDDAEELTLTDVSPSLEYVALILIEMIHNTGLSHDSLYHAYPLGERI